MISHVAVALTAAGFDTREVPPQRSSQQRRSRRLAKTDVVDAVSVARALQGEPSVGPVQTLEVYDPLVAKIEAVLVHRRALVEVRTLVLHYAQDQIWKLPTEIRDQLGTTGNTEARLRALEHLDTTAVSTPAGAYRLSWVIPLVEQDRVARRQIRQLEAELDELLDLLGSTLRDEGGIGPIAAATLLVKVGDPFRFARESKFARCAAPAPCRPVKATANPSGIASTTAGTGASTACSTSPASPSNATATTPRTTSTANSPKAKPDEKHAAHTNDTSPTASSDACGTTNNDASTTISTSPLDKGASDSPTGETTLKMVPCNWPATRTTG